jgi:hypothetical protein
VSYDQVRKIAVIRIKGGYFPFAPPNMNSSAIFDESHSVPMKSVVFQRVAVTGSGMIDISKSYIGKKNRRNHLAHETIPAIRGIGYRQSVPIL